MRTREVVFFGFDQARLIDITGPWEVFATANALADKELYRIKAASVTGEDVICGAGARLVADCAVSDLTEPIDILMVPGTFEWARASQDEEILEAMRFAAARSKRIAAVCAGSFLVAAIGLLDGRRATTHWEMVDELARRFPDVDVDAKSIFVESGWIFTSAGGTAGIDLALAMVENDQGPELARATAQFLVVFMQRPGGAEQFSARMKAKPTHQADLRAVLDSIAENPAGDHRLAALSERAGFSERHLARLFKQELGQTPARYVESVRLEAARDMLQTSDAPLEMIARQSGLSSAETLRRAFAREVGVTPHAYRQRFRTTGVTVQDF